MRILIADSSSCKNRFYPIWKAKGEVVLGHLPEGVRESVEIDRDYLFKKGKSKSYFSDGIEATVFFIGDFKQAATSLAFIRDYVKSAYKQCEKVFAKEGGIYFYPELWGQKASELLYTAAETIHFLDYSYDRFKKDVDKGFSLDELVLVSSEVPGNSDELLERSAILGEAVRFCRDLVNGPANYVTVDNMVEEIESFCGQSGLKLTVFDEKELKARGMQLILAVGRASPQESKMVEIEYRPQGENSELPTICLVGKGVVYDSGGLYLKPGSCMDDMKTDMTGAAVTAAVIGAAARLELPVNITALIPMAENAIGPDAYRPGDVIRGLRDKYVEIRSTDAEGRLLLADALTYSDSKKPDLTIDVATLTGNIVTALGSRITGFFSRNSKVSDALRSASRRTGEDIWEMPLSDNYRDYFKSDIADMTNSAIPRREVGAVTAALFLGEFVDNENWVHLDIAGTAYASSEWNIYPKGATGIMVRTLTDFLVNFDKDRDL